MKLTGGSGMFSLAVIKETLHVGQTASKTNQWLFDRSKFTEGELRSQPVCAPDSLAIVPDGGPL
jgi:hypothetical protein